MLVSHEFTMFSEVFVVFPEVVEYLYIRSGSHVSMAVFWLVVLAHSP